MASRIEELLKSVTSQDKFLDFLQADVRKRVGVAIIYNKDTKEISRVFIGDNNHTTVNLQTSSVYNGSNNALVFHTPSGCMNDTKLSESDKIMANKQVGICTLSKEMFELSWDGKILLSDGTEQEFVITATGNGAGMISERYLDSMTLHLE